MLPALSLRQAGLEAQEELLVTAQPGALMLQAVTAAQEELVATQEPLMPEG